MSTLIIDDLKIITDNLSLDGKICVANLQILQQTIDKTEVEIEICQVAHDAAIDQVRRLLTL